VRNAVDRCLRGEGDEAGSKLHFYTMGRRVWQTTSVWPLPQTRWEDWWFEPNGALGRACAAEGQTLRHVVDPSASTGVDNRWHTQIGCKPVRHADRWLADVRLLVFDGPVLTDALEITGAPVVHLTLGCDRPDAGLFVYLEMVLPNGVVRLLTEGCLRLAHRRSKGRFRRADLAPMPPEGTAAVEVPLLPLSIELPAGVRLRIAIAGADADTFVTPAARPTTFTVQAGGPNGSRFSLPVIPGQRSL
jgi:uncharacterized protein